MRRRAILAYALGCALAISAASAATAGAGWTLAASTTGDTIHAYYLVEDGHLKIKWVNNNKCQPAEVLFQAKWEEKTYAGETRKQSTPWRSSVRLNAGSENHSHLPVSGREKDVRNVSVTIIEHKFGERRRDVKGCVQ